MKRLAFVFVFAISSLTSEALAVVGRPLTPMSYAGVARRTTRRAVYTTAAVSAATHPPPPAYW